MIHKRTLVMPSQTSRTQLINSYTSIIYYSQCYYDSCLIIICIILHHNFNITYTILVLFITTIIIILTNPILLANHNFISQVLSHNLRIGSQRMGAGGRGWRSGACEWTVGKGELSRDILFCHSCQLCLATTPIFNRCQNWPMTDVYVCKFTFQSDIIYIALEVCKQ
jgi:hypothetical protein